MKTRRFWMGVGAGALSFLGWMSDAHATSCGLLLPACTGATPICAGGSCKPCSTSSTLLSCVLSSTPTYQCVTTGSQLGMCVAPTSTSTSSSSSSSSGSSVGVGINLDLDGGVNLGVGVTVGDAGVGVSVGVGSGGVTVDAGAGSTNVGVGVTTSSSSSGGSIDVGVTTSSSSSTSGSIDVGVTTSSSSSGTVSVGVGVSTSSSSSTSGSIGVGIDVGTSSGTILGVDAGVGVTSSSSGSVGVGVGVDVGASTSSTSGSVGVGVTTSSSSSTSGSIDVGVTTSSSSSGGIGVGVGVTTSSSSSGGIDVGVGVGVTTSSSSGGIDLGIDAGIGIGTSTSSSSGSAIPSCISDSQCGNSSLVCDALSAICVIGCRAGGTTCATGQQCTSVVSGIGVCTAIPATEPTDPAQCSLDSDCGEILSATICSATHQCIPGCRLAGGNTCGIGLDCITPTSGGANICVAVPSTPASTGCSADSDCGSGHVCDSDTGSCIDGCRSTSACSNGQVCNLGFDRFGLCVTPTFPISTSSGAAIDVAVDAGVTVSYPEGRQPMGTATPSASAYADAGTNVGSSGADLSAVTAANSNGSARTLAEAAAADGGCNVSSNDASSSTAAVGLLVALSAMIRRRYAKKAA